MHWRSWLRHGIRIILLAVFLGFVLPNALYWGGTVCNHIAEKRAKAGPDWPCDPWGSRPLRAVADGFYRCYYCISTPTRLIALRIAPNLRKSYCDGENPNLVALPFSIPFPLSWRTLRGLWHKLGYYYSTTYAPIIRIWLIIAGFLEILWSCCFSKRQPRSKRWAGWWIVAATVVIVTAVVIVLRTVSGLSCGAWNWPLLVVAGAAAAVQTAVLRRAGRQHEQEPEGAGSGIHLHRLQLMTWFLAAINVALWIVVTPL